MKKFWKVLLILVMIIAVLAAAYVSYILLSYHRIGDVPLEVGTEGSDKTARVGETYTISSYNVGFGAYEQDYTCVLDTANELDENGEWQTVKGKNLKAFSYENALANTTGAATTIRDYDPDFAFFQEIDIKSNRCYGIDQTKMVIDMLPDRDGVFCMNFHMPFLCYPVNDMMGSVESGLLTLSRFHIASAERREFTVTDNIIDRLFDLDRCFSASYVDVENGKQLVLVNLHMSAYDEGGVIRNQQRAQLYSFLETEYQKGNYIIVGGDFNHDLLTNNPDYPEYDREHVAFADRIVEKPAYSVVWFFDENREAGLPEGIRVVASDNGPTCRSAGTTWQPDFSYVYCLDGFLVSDNVTVLAHENLITATDKAEGFAYSDHEPATMTFSLNP